VIANLLANARTHTPVGTRIETSLRQEPGKVVLTVTDDGPGIPEELQRNVFERFVRGDEARNRASGSTGLGLSIVAAVTAAHGMGAWGWSRGPAGPRSSSSCRRPR
jgi:two-component system OmpR family sensor kinase